MRDARLDIERHSGDSETSDSVVERLRQAEGALLRMCDSRASLERLTEDLKSLLTAAKTLSRQAGELKREHPVASLQCELAGIMIVRALPTILMHHKGEGKDKVHALGRDLESGITHVVQGLPGDDLVLWLKRLIDRVDEQFNENSAAATAA